MVFDLCRRAAGVKEQAEDVVRIEVYLSLFGSISIATTHNKLRFDLSTIERRNSSLLSIMIALCERLCTQISPCTQHDLHAQFVKGLHSLLVHPRAEARQNLFARHEQGDLLRWDSWIGMFRLVLFCSVEGGYVTCELYA